MMFWSLTFYISKITVGIHKTQQTEAYSQGTKAAVHKASQRTLLTILHKGKCLEFSSL
jgi:hypothetical protein